MKILHWKDKLTVFYNKYEMLFSIFIFLIVLLFIVYKEKKHSHIINIIKKGYINIIIVAVIIIGVVYIIKFTNINSSTKDKLIDTLKKSIIAFIIAIFAELGLIFAPFYLIFMFVFFSHGWF